MYYQNINLNITFILSSVLLFLEYLFLYVLIDLYYLQSPLNALNYHPFFKFLFCIL